MTALRTYQSDVIDNLKTAVASGKRRVLLVAATGAGKTIIASALVAGAVAKRRRAQMVAHRRELIAWARSRRHA
ncbi:MAG: DEAD/DEAH box helicase family protein [Rhizobiaceae bacterium]